MVVAVKAFAMGKDFDNIDPSTEAAKVEDKIAAKAIQKTIIGTLAWELHSQSQEGSEHTSFQEEPA